MVEQSLTPHPTQHRSFRRRSSQPITWLILTNKEVQENKHAKTKYKSDKANNLKTAKINYPGSVASYDTRPGNEVGLFYNDNTHGPRNPHGAISSRMIIVLFWESTVSECILDQEGESQKATLVVLLVVVISSLKICKAFLIRSGAQRNFAHTFPLTFPWICCLRFSTYFLINE